MRKNAGEKNKIISELFTINNLDFRIGTFLPGQSLRYVFILWSKIEVIEAQWTEWTMCTVGSKSRDRTLQDGCLIDECETVTEECIPQGKGVTYIFSCHIYSIFDPWDQ